MILFHRVTTELHIGMLMLAGLCIGLDRVLKGRKRNELPQGPGAFRVTARLGAGMGLLCLGASMATGLLSWPWERLLATRVVYGKISYTLVSLTCWALFLLFQRGHGPRRAGPPGDLFAAVGVLATLGAASAGGHLGTGKSLLDEASALVSLDLYPVLAFPIPLSLTLIVGCIVLILFKK